MVNEVVSEGPADNTEYSYLVACLFTVTVPLGMILSLLPESLAHAQHASELR